MQRLVDETFAGSRRIDGVDADLVGVIGWIVAHRMTGAALASGKKKTSGQGYAGCALDYPASDGIAGSKATGVHPRPGRPIVGPVHC
jgi:hypothetical protein